MEDQRLVSWHLESWHQGLACCRIASLEMVTRVGKAVRGISWVSLPVAYQDLNSRSALQEMALPEQEIAAAEVPVTAATVVATLSIGSIKFRLCAVCWVRSASVGLRTRDGGTVRKAT